MVQIRSWIVMRQALAQATGEARYLADFTEKVLRYETFARQVDAFNPQKPSKLVQGPDAIYTLYQALQDIYETEANK